MATQASLDLVQELYVAYYGRPADTAGQEYWAERVDAEGEGAILNAFGNSEEFQEAFGDLSSSELVTNLYQQLFSRDPEAAGLSYWVGVLESGEKSLAEIAVTIKNAAQNSDKAVLEAKVAAAAEYTEANGGETYNVQAAQAIVAEAGADIAGNEALTEALNTLSDAQAAEAEFLNAQVDNELLAEADLTEESTLADIRTAIDTAAGEAQGALDADIDADGTQRSIEADLADAEEAVSDYEAEIAKVDGLAGAIAAKDAAQEQIEAAEKALVDVNADLAGEVVTYGQLNGIEGDVAVAYLDDADNKDADPSDVASITVDGVELFTVSNGELTSVAGEDVKGVAALQAALQSKLDAELVLEEAEEADVAADASLDAVELTDAQQADLNDAADADAVYMQLEGLKAVVTDAEAVIDERAELVEAAEATAALNTEADALADAVTEADEALTDSEEDGGLGVTLLSAGEDNSFATDTAEVYLFDAEAGAQSLTGFASEDKIFVGDSFTQVDLAANANFANAQGDVSTLEVFFQQEGTGTVLSFENEAFAGNGTTTSDMTQITLTGVNVEDLSLDSGYITVA